MSRLPALLLVLLAPVVFAHAPAGAPDPLCETGAVHDYGGVGALYLDPSSPFAGPLPTTVDGALANPLCLGGDGHEEFAVGGATLAVASGNGVSGGSLACLGQAGHHGATVQALDTQGFGPRLYVLADHSRVPPASGPDCGDGVIESCFYPGPTSSPWPWPASVVVATVDAILYGLAGGGSATCTPGDVDMLVPSTASGPSSGALPFSPGADGAYHVVVAADWLAGRVPAAGHVWTA